MGNFKLISPAESANSYNYETMKWFAIQWQKIRTKVMQLSIFHSWCFMCTFVSQQKCHDGREQDVDYYNGIWTGFSQYSCLQPTIRQIVVKVTINITCIKVFPHPQMILCFSFVLWPQIALYIPIQLFHNMYSTVFLIVTCIIIFSCSSP